jgi:hypothetical protein
VTTPVEPPNWAFGPDQKIKCPTCKTSLSGINWIEGTPEGATEPMAVGMTVIPCGHEFLTPPWRYDVSGRGNVTIFKEKDR